jgi:hypothetical protein
MNGVEGQPRLFSVAVPIESASDEIVGVLGMSVQLETFQPLYDSGSGPSSHRAAILVETAGPLRGTLVHHPKNDRLGAAPNGVQQDLALANMDGEILQQLAEIESDQTQPVRLQNYRDPLEPSRYLSSCEAGQVNWSNAVGSYLYKTDQ